MLIIVGLQVYDKYINIIKERRKYSNLFFQADELYNLCNENKLEAYEEEDNFLIIKKEDMFCELYYLCNSWEWIGHLDQFKNIYSSLIINIIKKDDSEVKIFSNHKIYSYKTYQRLRKISKNIITQNVIDVRFCVAGDEHELRQIMLDTFDVFTDKIPSFKELKILIQQKKIICIRNESEIKGFIIFEDKRQSSYIRMLCINRDYRGEGLGDCLMQQYLEIHPQIKNFTLWYDINNIPAFNLYKKWGYIKENIFDVIYLI